MNQVRLYGTDDYKQVLALYKNKAAYGGNFDPERDEADRLAATAQDGNLYVCERAGQIIGTIMILDNPHSFWLLRFAVDPSVEGHQEVAQDLFENARRIAAQRGHKSVIMYTDAGDAALRERYSALGCHEANNYTCFWKETTV